VYTKAFPGKLQKKYPALIIKYFLFAGGRPLKEYLFIHQILTQSVKLCMMNYNFVYLHPKTVVLSIGFMQTIYQITQQFLLAHCYPSFFVILFLPLTSK
jgi:hypothetical protein